MLDLVMSAAGFGVGVVVGLTGIGGGALMTPVLVLAFGVAPHTAVGTDLVFACITKLFGVLAHGRRGTVDWLVVGRLAAGSLPAAALMMLWLAWAESSPLRAGVIMRVLGLALLLTSGGLLLRRRLHEVGKRLRTATPAHFKRAQAPLTVVAGFVVGALVALTSVGAGALATVALVYLYPYRLSPAKLVGTDLAHAIPLTLIAGAGHLALGNIELGLLGSLLLGSIPGILVGSMFSARAPEAVVRYAMAAVLVVVALRLLW
jgi:uncharacterized membrane protein YfcA